VVFTNGIATASIILYKAESAVIRTTDGTISATGNTHELPVTVLAASFNKLAVSLASPQVNGTAFTGTNTLTAQDAYGNTVTSFNANSNNITVSTTLTGAITGLSGTNKLSGADDFVNGVADLTSLSLTFTGTVGTGTFTFAPATGTGITSGNVTFSPGIATRMIVTGSTTGTAGTAQTVTLTAKDASGNTVTTYTGDKSIVFTGAILSANPSVAPTVTDKNSAAVNFGTAATITFTNGVATTSMTLYRAEVASIVATQGGVTSTGSDRLITTYSANTLSKFAVSLTNSQINGTAFTGSNNLTAQDFWANTVTTFDASANNVTVTTSLTGAISGLTGTNKLSGAGDFVNGVANLTSKLIFTGTSGTGTFTFASATGGATVTSANVTVVGGAATKLRITGSASETAGAAQSITITALDANGNTAVAYTGSKSLTFSGANASLSPATNPTVAGVDFGTTTNLTFTSGVANGNLVLYKAENALVAVTDGTLSASGSDRLSVTIASSSYSKLAVTLASPQSNGVAFTGTNNLTAQDDYGNTVTTFNASSNNITVTTSLTGSISGLSGTNKLTSSGDFVNGVANLTSALTFTGTSGTGTFTFSPVTGTAVTSSNVTIGSGTATKLVITGASATQTAGGTQTISVTAKDANGNTVTSYTGTKSITFSGANASSNPVTNPTVAGTNVGTATNISFTNGVATASLALFKAETLDLAATDGSISAAGSDRFNVTVSASTYTKLVASLATPQTNGTAFTGTNTLTAQDAYGNTVAFNASTNNVTVSTTLTGGITGLSGTDKLTNSNDFVNGVANLSSLGLTFTGTSGTGTFTFTPATGTASTSANVTVNPGTVSRLVITGTASVTAGDTQTITLRAKDASGNVVTTYTGDKSIVFSGANQTNSPVVNPTVSDKTSANVNFGTATTITFTNGEATASMKLYRAESALIVATEGALASSGADRLSVAVAYGSLSKFAVNLASPQVNATAFTGTNEITAQDTYSNTVLNFNASANNVTISTSLSGAISGLSGTNKLSSAGDFVSGVANLTTKLIYTGTSGAGTFTALAATGGATGTSSSITISSSLASKLVITGTGTGTAGSAQTITITAKDASGNTATGYTGTKSLTFSGATSSTSPVTAPTIAGTNIGTATNISFTNGVASASFVPYKAETATLDVTDGTILAAGSDRLAVTVSESSFTKLAVSLASPQVNGTAFTGTNTLTAQDAYGNAVTSFTASTNNITVTKTLTGTITGLSGGAVLNAHGDFVNGVANLTSKLLFTGTSGTGTFTFSPATGTAVTSGNVVVNPGAATKLVITATPGAITAGTTKAITITAQDASGNTTTSYAGDKNLIFSTSTTPSKVPTASNKNAVDIDFGLTTVVTFVNGVGTSTLKGYKSELTTVSVTDGTISSSGGGNLPLDITPGTFSKLAVSLASPQTSGTAFTGVNTLTAQDEFGNTVNLDASTNNVTVTSSLEGTITGLSGTNKLNNANDFVGGVANLTTLGLIYTGASGTGTFTFTPATGTAITSSNVTINPGTVSRLEITGTGTQMAGGSQTITLRAKDASGNIVPSYTGDKSIVFSGALSSTNPFVNPTVTDKNSTAVNFGTATIITFTNGVASATMKLYRAETSTIVATQGALASSGGDRLSVVVSPASLSKFAVALSTPQINGQAFTSSNIITAQDAYGNTVTSFDASANNVTVTTSLTGSITGLSGTNKLSSAGDFVNGISDLSSKLTFTGTSGTGTFTFTSTTGGITGTSANIAINGGTATKLVISGNATQTAGSSQTITLTAQDANGNTAIAYTGVKSITFSGATSSPSPATNPTVSGVNFGTAINVTFTNGVASANMILFKAESAVVSATDASISTSGSDRLTVAVSAASFSKLSVSLASPQNSGVAFTGTNTLTALDAYGNTVTGFDASANPITITSTLTGSITGYTANVMNQAGNFSSGVANLSSSLVFTGTAGTGTFTFTPQSGTAVTSGNVTINAGAATKLFITGTGTQTAGASQTITITAKDASGNTAASYTGDKNLTFSGANSSANPATAPTATNKNSVATNLGSTTVVSFTNGVATADLKVYKAESAEIQVTDGTINSTVGGSLSITVSPAAFSKLAVSLVGSQANGVAFTGSNTLTALDAYGNTVTGFDASGNNITVTTSLTGSISGLSGTDKLSSAGDFSNGIANLSSLGMKFTGTVGTGTFTFTPTSGTAVTSGNVSIGSGVATRLVVTGTGTQTAGGTQTITITAKDANGNTVTSYTGDHALTISGANDSNNPIVHPTVIDKNAVEQDIHTGATLTFTNGVATTTLALYTAEVANLAVSDGSISAAGADRLTVTVSPSTFSKLVVSLSSPQTNRVAFTGTNTLTAQDAYGNTVTSFSASSNNVTVTTALTGTISGLSGTNKLTSGSDFVNGVANLTSLGLKYSGTIGTGTFTFTPASGSAAVSTSITMGAGPADHIMIVGTETQTAGTSQSLTIRVVDANHNTVTSYAGTKTLVFSGANSSTSPVTAPTVNGTAFGSNTSVVFTSGIATVSLTLYKAENAVVQVSDGTLVAVGNHHELPVTVSATSFNKLAVSLASPQNSGIAFTGTNTLQALDAYGNLVTTFNAAGNNVTVTVNTLTGSISGLSGTNVLNAGADFSGGVANLTSLGLVYTGNTGTGTFTFTPASGTAVTSGNVTIGAGSASKFIVTGTGTQTAGASQNITITAKDASGNTATGYTGAKSITFSGANASSSPATNPTVAGTNFGTATSVTFSNGVATVSMSLYKVESASVVATDGSVTTSGSDRLSVTVSPATFSKLALSLAGPQTNGIAFSGTNSLTALDAYGNVVTGFDASGNNVTVTTSLTGSITGLSGTNKLTSASDFVNGVANLTSLGLKFTGTVGSGTFTFTPATGTAVTSGSISINSGSATYLVITGTGTQTAGGTQTITITAKDAQGNTATTYTGDKSLTFSGANSSTSPTTAPSVNTTAFASATTVNFSSGVATATLALYRAESATVAVSDGTIAAAGSDRLSITVSAASLSKFALSFNSPQSSGVAFTGTNTITAQDAYGNTVTGFSAATNNVTITSNLTGSISGLSGTNKLSGAGDFVSGVADVASSLIFTGNTGNGTFTATATTGGATGTSLVTIGAGAATKLVITGSSTQTAGASQTITITAKDASGNTASGYTGAKSLTFSGATSSSSPVTAATVAGTNVGTATSISFSNGVATASLNLYQVESAVLAATDGSISAAGSDRLTVAVSAGSFSKLAVSLTSPQTSGTAFSGTNSLTALDAYGNTVTGFDASANNITVTTSLSGTISGLSGTTKLSGAGDFSNGVASVNSLIYTGTAGTGTFTFTPASGTAVTSGNVTIGAGSASKFIVTGTGTQTAGASQNITITAKDASGNTATGYTGAKSITFSGANASSSPATTPTVAGTNFGTATSVTFSNGVATVSMSLYKVESASVVATDGSVTTSGSDRLSVTVSPATFSKLALSLVGPQTNGIAFSGTNSLTALDAYGNVVTGFDASGNNVTVTTSLT
ncbi:beta strand repeat-containing protein, partial [Aquirufa aurantiipilula]